MVIALPQSGVDRRAFPRVEIPVGNLHVTVGILGFAATRGVVLDVSRGGLKVALGREISERSGGYDYLIRFDDPEDRVEPKVKVGKLIRRIGTAVEYAIEFDSSLEVLNMGSDPETVEPGSGASEPQR